MSTDAAVLAAENISAQLADFAPSTYVKVVERSPI